MKKYLGLTIANSIFPPTCVIKKEQANIDEIKNSLNEIIICINVAYKWVLEAFVKKFKISLTVPQNNPQPSLTQGDTIYVLSVKGLSEKGEYTEEEINKATFELFKYTVE